MSTLTWIVLSGLGMSVLALVGSVTLILPERTLKRLVIPLVSLAAGTLLGGALFHMLPVSVAVIGNRLSVYVAVVAGFATFFVLEQWLQWHHCHRVAAEHAPLGYLILLADGAQPRPSLLMPPDAQGEGYCTHEETDQDHVLPQTAGEDAFSWGPGWPTHYVPFGWFDSEGKSRETVGDEVDP